MIHYEEEVKKVYPDAELKWWPRTEIYTIISGYVELGRSLDSDPTWQSAYETLKKQGKI